MMGGRDFHRGWLVGSLVAACALVSAPSALAATFTVDTTSATHVSGKTTLTEAINAANTAGGANTVVFQAGLSTVTLPAAGFPDITDSGLTIDGCANAGSVAAGGCQQISANLVSDASDGPGIITIDASGVTITGINFNDSGGSGNNDASAMIYADPIAAGLKITNNTLTGDPDSNVQAIDSEADNVVVGGLDPATHQPSGGNSITSNSWGIWIDTGVAGDLVEGNTIGVQQTGGIYTDGSSTKIIANSVTIPAVNGGPGVEVELDATDAEIGDSTLKAPPNTFHGVTHAVTVEDGGIAYFYDNTGIANSGSSIESFYDNGSSIAPLAPIFNQYGYGVNGAFTGSAQANSTVELIGISGIDNLGRTVDMIDGGVEAVVQADGSGHWSWTPPPFDALQPYIAALDTVPGEGSSNLTLLQGPVDVELTEADKHGTVTAVAGSAATPSVCAGATCWAPYGSVVTFTYNETSSGGWGVRQWGGPCASGTYDALTTYNPTCAIQVEGPVDAPITEWLGIQLGIASGSGGSLVAGSPSAGSCVTHPTDLDCFVPPGTNVTLTAEPANGYQLVSWGYSSPCPGTTVASGVCTLNNFSQPWIGQTAGFQKPPTFTIAGAAAPANAGTVKVSGSGGGVTCGTTSCTARQGATITLTATAASGAVFSSWTGCAGADVSSTGTSGQTSATCTFHFLTATGTVTANFSDVVPVVLSGPIKVTGGGSSVPIKCAGAGPHGCIGTASLVINQGIVAAAARGELKKTKAVVIASGHFSLKKGKTGKVTLKASAAGRSYDKAHKHQTVTATETISATDPSGHRVTVSRSVKIKLG